MVLHWQAVRQLSHLLPWRPQRPIWFPPIYLSDPSFTHDWVIGISEEFDPSRPITICAVSTVNHWTSSPSPPLSLFVTWWVHFKFNPSLFGTDLVDDNIRVWMLWLWWTIHTVFFSEIIYSLFLKPYPFTFEFCLFHFQLSWAAEAADQNPSPNGRLVIM